MDSDWNSSWMERCEQRMQEKGDSSEKKGSFELVPVIRLLPSAAAYAAGGKIIWYNWNTPILGTKRVVQVLLVLFLEFLIIIHVRLVSHRFLISRLTAKGPQVWPRAREVRVCVVFYQQCAEPSILFSETYWPLFNEWQIPALSIGSDRPTWMVRVAALEINIRATVPILKKRKEFEKCPAVAWLASSIMNIEGKCAPKEGEAGVCINWETGS